MSERRFKPGDRVMVPLDEPMHSESGTEYLGKEGTVVGYTEGYAQHEHMVQIRYDFQKEYVLNTCTWEKCLVPCLPDPAPKKDGVFNVGDRVRAIRGDEGQAYDRNFWDHCGTVAEKQDKDGTYIRVVFDDINNPVSGSWTCRPDGLRHLPPYTADAMEQELTQALLPLFKEAV